jgi:hypothetical protein
MVRAWDDPSGNRLPDPIAEMPLIGDELCVVAVHELVAEHVQASGSLRHRVIAM